MIFGLGLGLTLDVEDSDSDKATAKLQSLIVVILMQLWRLQYVRDGISLDSLYLCLPIRISQFL